MIRSTVATLAVAILPAVAAGQSQQGRDQTTFTWSKALPAGARVTIRNSDGPIKVTEASGDRVEVRATKVVRSGGATRDVSFDVEESGGDVEICTLYFDQASCRDRNRGTRNSHVRVEYLVSVPHAARVNVATGNGDVSIDRAGDEVSASTGNGRVEIGETSGRVDASTGNGDVEIRSANGPVKVSTGNGRVSVVTARGGVSATTGNGDIDVRMTAVTSDADMNFSSGSGSLRIRFPADFNGRVDASTGSGSLRSDFEISVVGRLDAHHIRGTIGKGGALVRLSTGSGQIELLKN